jgi:hypothetical protein
VPAGVSGFDAPIIMGSHPWLENRHLVAAEKHRYPNVYANGLSVSSVMSESMWTSIMKNVDGARYTRWK